MARLGEIELQSDDLVQAIHSLAQAVRYQGDSITTLMDAAQAEADASLKPLDAPTVHGFKDGDAVMMFTPGGCVFGTVDRSAYRTANPEKNLPIRRDSGGGDAWPARYVVLNDAHTKSIIEKLTPGPVFGLGVPPSGTDRHVWNRAASEIAAERTLPITFDYDKPDSWGRATERHILVKKFEAVSDSPRMQSIGGVDLDLPETPGASRYRTFRLDRIVNHIRVEDAE